MPPPFHEKRGVHARIFPVPFKIYECIRNCYRDPGLEAISFRRRYCILFFNEDSIRSSCPRSKTQFRDIEVKNGQVKAGSVKHGEQWHLQVIVSRKDITNSVKLSPMNKSRGKNVEHSKKLGQFDRSAFKQSGEILFDEMFGFDR